MIAAHLDSLLFFLLVAVAVLFQFRLVPVSGEDSRQNRQRSVKANIDADSQDAYANATRAGRV